MVNLIFLLIKDRIESGTYLIYDCACGSGGMLTEAEAFMQKLADDTGKKIAIPLLMPEASSYAGLSSSPTVAN